MATPIEEALDALKQVVQIHENHLYPRDHETLKDAIGVLEALKQDGFE